MASGLGAGHRCHGAAARRPRPGDGATSTSWRSSGARGRSTSPVDSPRPAASPAPTRAHPPRPAIQPPPVGRCSRRSPSGQHLHRTRPASSRTATWTTSAATAAARSASSRRRRHAGGHRLILGGRVADTGGRRRLIAIRWRSVPCDRRLVRRQRSAAVDVRADRWRRCRRRYPHSGCTTRRCSRPATAACRPAWSPLRPWGRGHRLVLATGVAARQRIRTGG